MISLIGRYRKECILILLFSCLGFYLDGILFVYRLLSYAAIGTFCFYHFKNSNYGFYVLFAFVIAVNLFHIHIDILGPDAKNWLALANGQSDHYLTMYRPKLYIWFIEILSMASLVVMVQLLLKLFILVQIVIIGKERGWRDSVIGLVVLLFGLNSIWINEQFTLHDTTLFSFLWLTAFNAYYHLQKYFRPFWFVVFAVSCGLCTLTRQTADLFILLMWIHLILIHRQKIKQVASLAVLCLFIAQLGAVANSVEFGIYKRSIALGVNLYSHSSYYELSTSTSKAWNELNPPYEKPFGWKTSFSSPINWEANAIPHIYQRQLEKTGMSRLESDQFLKRKFLDWAFQNPGVYFSSIVNEMKRFLLVTDEYYPKSIFSFATQYSDFLVRLERGLIHTPLWIFALLPLMYMILNRFPSKLFILSYGIGLFYLIMLSTVQLGFTRYSLPVIGFFMIALGEGLNTFFNRNLK